MKHHIVTTMAFAAALVAAAPAFAQRASLAERVAALENQAASNQGNVDLLNQVTQLKSEVQTLRSQIEELQRQVEQHSSPGPPPYLALNCRRNRLESAGGRCRRLRYSLPGQQPLRQFAFLACGSAVGIAAPIVFRRPASSSQRRRRLGLRPL